MNQDVFGNPTDTSGAMGLLSYTNQYDKYVDKSDSVWQAKGEYAVRISTATNRHARQYETLSDFEIAER